MDDQELKYTRLQEAYQRVITERDRYLRAMKELKGISNGWEICSDPRSIAYSMIRNALDLAEPLYVMRNGKWLPADKVAELDT